MNVAIILAAGLGKRFGSKTPKQFQILSGKPLFLHSLEKFLIHKEIDKIFLVINPEYQKKYEEILKDYDIDGLIIGGETRQKSAFNALEKISHLKPNKILIHDAARPFISLELISKILTNIKDPKNAIVPGIKATDSLREIDSNNLAKTIERDKIYQIQTPQGFFFQTLFDLHKKFQHKDITDDARLYEFAKAHNCKIIEGEAINQKITRASDLNSANKPNYKIGFGTDIHKFAEEEKDCEIKIAGVAVKHNKSILAHSDGDVVLHALVDALLGSCALGDIGEYFPDNDPKFKNLDSEFFVKAALEETIKHQLKIVNIDVIINCERPKLLNYKAKMQQNLARILNISKEQINIKAKTNEKLDAIGAKKAISASVSLLATNFEEN